METPVTAVDITLPDGGRARRQGAMRLGVFCALVLTALMALLIISFTPTVGIFSAPQSVNTAAGFETVGRIAHPHLDEASGLAVSSTSSDLLWFVNDDGTPMFFAQRSSGEASGAVVLPGFINRDWESLARFQWRQKPWLLAADVGDNLSRYPSVWLYAVPEPSLNALQSGLVVAGAELRQVEVVLEAGAADIEAVAVDAHAAQILLITKRERRQLIYAVPLAPIFANAPASSSQVTARVLGKFDTPRLVMDWPQWLDFKLLAQGSGPTGLDISPDGISAVVLTYRGLWLYTRKPHESWPDAFQQTPTLLGEHGLKQAESVGFSAEGDAVFLSSEGRDAPIVRFALGN